MLRNWAFNIVIFLNVVIYQKHKHQNDYLFLLHLFMQGGISLRNFAINGNNHTSFKMPF